MTHEHELDRDKLPSHERTRHDRSIPGRSSASAALRGPVAPEPSGILARAADGSGVRADADHHVALASTSAGTPLPSELRESFEDSLGADLSGVRVHRDASSETAAQAVGAKAYTIGQDIHFGAGQFDPSSSEGQLLLAHEVAHTVQQAGGPAARQNKLAVSSPVDAAELEADRAAEAMVARKPYSLAATSSGTAARVIHRKAAAGASISAKNGVTFTYGLPAKSLRLGYVTVSNPSVAVTAKPTTDAEVKTRPADQTEGSVGVTPGNDGEASIKSDEKGTKGNEYPSGIKVEGAIKKKWGNVAFTDAMADVGTSGGAVSLTAGGEWKNLVLSVKFALLSFGKDGKDIKFLTATASGKVRGTIDVDGVHFAVSLTLSADVKPNSKAIARFLIKKGIVKSLRGFGEAFEAAAALPALFVEGGYETLKAAYKNVVAGKDIAAFVDAANKVSLEVGDNFVAGVLGGSKGQGSKSGKLWFQKAYEVAKADNPEMTQDEFRQALIASPSWQENAKITIARQIRGVLYDGFVESKKDDIHAKDMKHVKEMLFGEDTPPDQENGLGVAVPKVEKIADPNHRDIEEEHSSKGIKIPPAVRDEAIHRVGDGQLTGSIPYNGTNYEFTYDRGAILVHGGEQSEIIPFQR